MRRERLWSAEAIVRDVRLAARSLVARRGFSSAVVSTLAIGIGSVTAIFSVVEAVLLRPLPYRDADRIVTIAARAAPQTGLIEHPFSAGGFWHFERNARSFESFGGYLASGTRWRAPLIGADGSSVEVTRSAVQLSALEVLGVDPLLGRLPTPEEERRTPVAPVVLISHGLWVDRFASDPAVVGRVVTLRDWSAEVIGVMPEYFAFPSPEVDVWTLGRLHPGNTGVAEHSWLAIGRLAPGVTIADAVVEAEALIAGFNELPYGSQRLEDLFSGDAIVRPLTDAVVGSARLPLWLALGTTVFVLLVACGNVANLLLLRGESRRREQAIRMAMGSGRWRVVRYALVESSLLTAAGAAVGLCVAHLATRAIVSLGPVSVPRLEEISMDARVLLFALFVSVLAALAGLLPALRAGRASAIQAAGAGMSPGHGMTRILDGLVVTQTAMALVLLLGAGLLLNAFQRLHAVDPGFETDGVLTFRLTPPAASRYRGDSGARFDQFFHPLLEQLRALPGVLSVGGTSSLPLTGVVAEPGSTLGPIQVEEFPVSEGAAFPNFITKRTSPGYFEAMGIRLLEGRGFTIDDYSPDYSSTAFIVSAAVKRRYWPNESALGKRLIWGRMSGPIVGVMDEVRHRGLSTAPDEIVHSAQLGRELTIVMKVDGAWEPLVPLVRATVTSMDPEVRVTRVETMEALVGDSVDRIRFVSLLLALAAGISLFLGAVGIYGVVSFVTVHRVREWGVRMALGASPGVVGRSVLWRGVSVTGVGVALGFVVFVPLSASLEAFLYEISPLDPPTLVLAVSLLLSISVGSCLIPATRAARTPPAAALRTEP